MGGVQNISALPGDPTFNEIDNKYDVTSYKTICNEFGIDHSSDFRFTTGPNGGLGAVYTWVRGPLRTSAAYPGYDKFSDEGGDASKGNAVTFIRTDDIAREQTNWFCPNIADGLTRAGLSRINQSIEAFVYCLLGAQINTRSSIIGTGGRSKETENEFLVLLEDAIRQPDLAKSVQRYQLAVQEAKVRLNLAVCPGEWLMPARMIINTESTAGWNNKLKQATANMKLGVNNDVNTETKTVGVTHMDGEPPKNKKQPIRVRPNTKVTKTTTTYTKVTKTTTTNTTTTNRRARRKQNFCVCRFSFGFFYFKPCDVLKNAGKKYGFVFSFATYSRFRSKTANSSS